VDKAIQVAEQPANGLRCVGRLILDHTVLTLPFSSEVAPHLTGFLEFAYLIAARATSDVYTKEVKRVENIADASGWDG
jgi:hypothetical protein